MAGAKKRRTEQSATGRACGQGFDYRGELFLYENFEAYSARRIMFPFLP
jgi:hypothetical protein